MEGSNFLSQIGLAKIDIGYILLAFVIVFIILIVMNIISLVKIKNLNQRLKKFIAKVRKFNLETMHLDGATHLLRLR